jgi:hypothetical protein
MGEPRRDSEVVVGLVMKVRNILKQLDDNQERAILDYLAQYLFYC